MDQEITKCLNTKFRKLLVVKMIHNIEHKKETKLNALDAIMWLAQSWSEITIETVNNCFSHFSTKFFYFFKHSRKQF